MEKINRRLIPLLLLLSPNNVLYARDTEWKSNATFTPAFGRQRLLPTRTEFTIKMVALAHSLVYIGVTTYC